jgi:hypothetical protein
VRVTHSLPHAEDLADPVATLVTPSLLDRSFHDVGAGVPPAAP